jgi:hypothetical protein
VAEADTGRRVVVGRRYGAVEERVRDSWRSPRPRQPGDDDQAPDVAGPTAVGVCERDGPGIDRGRGSGGQARRHHRR